MQRSYEEGTLKETGLFASECPRTDTARLNPPTQSSLGQAKNSSIVPTCVHVTFPRMWGLGGKVQRAVVRRIIPASAFFFFGGGDQSGFTNSILLSHGSVHNGSAS